MIPSEIVIVDYSPSYGTELVKMWRESFEQAVQVIDPHPLPQQLRYLESQVAAVNHVRVVLDKSTSEVIAFMATTSDTISQLYVHVAISTEELAQCS
jgi:hypothetical protein